MATQQENKIESNKISNDLSATQTLPSRSSFSARRPSKLQSIRAPMTRLPSRSINSNDLIDTNSTITTINNNSQHINPVTNTTTNSMSPTLSSSHPNVFHKSNLKAARKGIISVPLEGFATMRKHNVVSLRSSNDNNAGEKQISSPLNSQNLITNKLELLKISNFENEILNQQLEIDSEEECSFSITLSKFRRFKSETFYHSWDFSPIFQKVKVSSPVLKHTFKRGSNGPMLPTTGMHRIIQQQQQPPPLITLELPISNLEVEQPITPRRTFTANILFEDNSDKLVVRGTISALIKHLADDIQSSPTFVEDFLCTHKYYISTRELFERLKQRYENPIGSIINEQNNDQNKIRVIRYKVVYVLKCWIDKFFFDFVEEDDLLRQLKQFLVKDVSTSGHSQWGKMLAELLHARVSLLSISLEDRLKLDDISCRLKGNRKCSIVLDESKEIKIVEPLINTTSRDYCFLGQKLIEWLEYSEGLTLDKSIGLANWLVQLHFVSPVHECDSILSPNSYYTIKELDEKIPRPLKPRSKFNLTFVDLQPLEIARQLSLIEQRLYCRIQRSELIFLNWKSNDREKKAQNISALVDWFNKISRWVCTEIVTTANMRLRTAIIVRFIQIAQNCFKLKNFNSMMEILSGLNNTSVQRLKRTWQAVSTREMQSYQVLQELMSNSMNFKNYREELKKSNGIALPYLGLILQDMIALEELVKMSKHSKKQGMVDFKKFRIMAATIRAMQQYQIKRYNFCEVESIKVFLHSGLVTLDDKELYKYSKICEQNTAVL
eukprot:TRINITY_DN1746_c0_g1_i1.p1 TRINITY_DN1746_c0_g1~~TRINITY_DN1746_c0_g1_i1.p1  ORF type:complete len:790 (-),score=247.11 TRINITY_DN1746_c0_g1_i1:3-2336(-)